VGIPAVVPDPIEVVEVIIQMVVDGGVTDLRNIVVDASVRLRWSWCHRDGASRWK
jgi:hypothetical protein